jgi:hypothetical protein
LAVGRRVDHEIGEVAQSLSSLRVGCFSYPSSPVPLLGSGPAGKTLLTFPRASGMVRRTGGLVFTVLWPIRCQTALLRRTKSLREVVHDRSGTGRSRCCAAAVAG